MTVATAIKAGTAVLSSDKLRKGFCWLLVIIFAPLILLTAVICSIGTGISEHNNIAVEAAFYGTAYDEKVPGEFKDHVEDMRASFVKLDAAVASVNREAESGGVDATFVKAAFYGLCFGDDVPSRREAKRFVKCFYKTETRTRTVKVENEDGTTSTEEEEYTVVVPLGQNAIYVNLAAELGREITREDKANIDHIYSMVSGSAEGTDGTGGARSGGFSIDLDASAFVNPGTKNAADLVAFAEYAWQSGWGYVWGTHGDVLTQSSLDALAAMYPQGVGDKYSLIQSKWLGSRTTDCVGLIKCYGWLDSDSLSIGYATNGMPDWTANQFYYAATESGPISTIPEIPGLAVWRDGHIGVYIGGGQVIEAMGTAYGVVKTNLSERNFTHWLKLPSISY